jgi:hypothetical protein
MQAARVLSIEALTEFRASLDHFVENAKVALSANEMEITRAAGWLDEQVKYWQKELRARQEGLVVAKTNLKRRKMMEINGRKPDCTEQEEAVDLAQRKLREAEEKLAQCKRWQPQLQREVDLYTAQVRHLSEMLEADLPRFSANFQQRLGALDAYVLLAPPATPGVPSAGSGAAMAEASNTTAPLPGKTPAPPDVSGSAPPAETGT